MAVIGIDLGTTYSAAARFTDGRPEIIYLEGKATLPSVVGLQKNGKIAVGWTAKRNQAKDPANTVVEAKRLMGSDKKIKLGQKEFSPPDISSMVLRRIKELAEAELNETITGVVITCPAYFNELQRDATKTAGELAGLKVLKIINEPTAAAYAYGVMQGTDNNESIYVVYDLGGGTFDVTVVRMLAGELQVLGTGGDPNLGGGDFDDRIVGWMEQKLKDAYPDYVASLNDEKKAAMKIKLKSYAEEGKIALCSMQSENPSFAFQIGLLDKFQDKPINFNATLTMTDFNQLIDQLMENSLHWIDEALKVPKSEKFNYTEEHLTAILLVGGSTRVPLVRDKLAKRFPKTPIWGQERGINPDEIVALGASISAAAEDPDNDDVTALPGTMLDVTGHTLSVSTWDSQKQKNYLSPIILKDTTIPVTESHKFHGMGNFQRQCLIKVYQGEGIEIDETKVTMITEFEIELQPIQAETPIEISLSIDGNGLLIAEATDLLTGSKARCEVNYKDSTKMSPEEVERRHKALEAQMSEILARAINPLEQLDPATATSLPSVSIPPTPTPPPSDPMAVMNPILRGLYQKAMASFAQVPEDKQSALITLIGEVDQAALANDQARLTRCTVQLSQMLQGIA